MRKTRRGTSKRRARADQRAAPDRAVHAPVAAAAPGPEGTVARHVILFLAANPVETERLALDREERAIRDALTRSRHRERFSLETRWAVQPQDLLGELRALRPSVLQFSGHGRRAEAAAQLHARAGEPRERDVAGAADAGASGLYLHDAGDGMHVVSPEALAAALAASQAPVRLAIVSACSTAGFADALLPHVECAIEMTGAIRDDAARSFAAALYGALGDHASIAAAFDQALAAIDVGGLPGAYVPRLRVRDGVDPKALVLAATPPVLRRSLPCPYPGLRPYSARDPGFQGRDREIRDVLAALRDGERAIYLRGRSGSGKSSLLAAGLLPRLKDAAGLGPFVVRELRPGEQPAARLAQALGAQPGERLIVAERVAALLRRRDPLASVLMVVDQLEELFTLAIAAEREQFIAAMRELRDEPRCVVICALRSDFTAELKHSRLWIDRGGRMPLIDIDPLGGDALRRAITEPAARLGVTVEPQLVERLLADAGGQPGTTPLIQETLVRLWDERTDQTLRLADYEALGADGQSGLAVALAGRANAAVRRLGPAHLTLARRILLRLVSFSEDHDDTRRQQPRSKLRAASDDARAFDGVLDQMIAARVLTTDDADDGDPRVDLGHEVVIKAWPLLAEWVDAHRGDEQRRRELEAAAARWVANGRGARGLLDEIDLADAEQWRHSEAARLLGGPSPELGDLIAASGAALARQRVRRRRVLAGACATLFVLLLIVTALAAAALHRGRRAIAGEQRVRELLARSYAEAGRKLLVDGHPQEAMPYLVEARRGGEDGPALRMLVRIAKRHLPQLPPLAHQREIVSVALSPDGTRLATAAWDHTARVWDTITGEPTTPPLEHMHWLVGVAFSPDASRFLTWSLDTAARLWDTATGRLLATLPHADAVVGAAFSPDGSLVLTACGDRTAKIWDAATGRPTTSALEHTGGPGGVVAFSADGRRALTTSQDGAAYLWAVAGGARIARFAQGHVASAAFSPDGLRVVAASLDGTVRIWGATGELVASLAQGGLGRAAFDLDIARRLTASADGAVHLEAGAGHAQLVRAGFSPGGVRLVTASADGAAHLWNATAGNLIAGPLAHAAEVVRAAFSPDGVRLYTASATGAVRIWDAVTGRALPGPFAHHGEVTGAAFSPDGTRVVTASKDGTARVWSAATGTPITGPLEHHGEVTSAVFSPDGARVATTSGDRTARVWSAATGTPITEPLEHRGRVWRAAFSRDGARIVTVSDDFTARVWNAATGEPLTLPLEHQDFVSVAVFTPDGSRVITASHDRLVRIWDAGVDQPAPRPLAHPESVGSAVFSPDGTRIVTTSSDNTARIWNAATGAPVACPLQHEDGVTSAAFSTDGMRVVTACADGAARVIDAASGELIAGFAHRGWVMSAAFSPDGTRVVTASLDSTAQVWDAATGKPVGAPLEHRGPVWRAAFSPEGTRVVTAAFDDTARVWDATTGAPITGPLEHQRGVTCAEFSPDGTRIVTAGGDWTAAVWDAVTGRRLATLVHDDKVAAARFSPDGTRVITASEDGTARVWNAATGQLIVSLLQDDHVVDAAFSPDGARVATASWDRSARVWDAATGNLLARFEHNGSVMSARFSADGSRLVTASSDRTARVWDVGLDAGTLDDWIAAAARSPFILARGALVRRPPR